MAERSEAVEEQAVRDASAIYSVEAEIAATKEIPPGYKRTEVGVIPEDWNQVSVAELAKVKGGKRLPKGHSLIESPTPHPYIRVADLLPGRVDGANIKFVPEKAFHSIQNYRIYKNDLFISVAGTLGLVGAIPSYLDGANLTENADRITDIECNRDYLMYWLMSESIQRAIESIRTVGAQPKLALGRIANFQIAIPSTLDEQRAIAAALSDADALIESLDRLNAKKRAIKQAAMQQLLTGQTRLPGFTGEWETKRLGELLTVRYGRNQSEVEKNDGRYPILATGGEIGRTDTPIYDRPSVLIGRKGTIDEPRFMDSPFWTVDTLFYTEIHESANPKFMFYIFKRIAWRDYNEASGVPSLNGKTIEAIQVLVPRIQEQTAIATVLSDMDTEIEALERRRNKARQIKQGMMQQLLTGRVRLVTPEVGA